MLAVPFMGQYQLILRPLRGEAIAGWEWALSLGSGFALAALVMVHRGRRYHPRAAGDLGLSRAPAGTVLLAADPLQRQLDDAPAGADADHQGCWRSY